MRKTKIVATIGPATSELEIMKKLIKAGINTARINFSHGTHESHAEIVSKLKMAREELTAPIALMLDTKGPEIRTKGFEAGSVTLKAGNKFILTTDDVLGDINKASVTYPDFVKDISVGSKILLDDGLIELKVTAIDGTNVETTIKNDGELGSNKGINLPDTKVNLPSLTEKDIEDIKFGIAMGFDLIAASFVRSAKDVLEIRSILEENEGSHIQIIAKIENREGVENLEEILEVSDGVMVARGDLGVEIPPEEVPLIQKKIIKQCNAIGKPVITATQMLESMTDNPRPTRAEANDVANAIFDGTDAVMLSGETAKGSYPVEAVRMMDRIAIKTEGGFDYSAALTERYSQNVVNVTNSVTYAACTTAASLNAACIVAVSRSGFTAKMVAKYRPNSTILVATSSEINWRQMNLVWGCQPVMIAQYNHDDDLYEASSKCAMQSGLANNGDIIVIVAGVPVGITGTTNLIKAHIVGNVLAKGRAIGKGSIVGKISVIKPSEHNIRPFQTGDILVAAKTDDSMMPYIRKAKALIVGSDQKIDNTHAEIACKALNIPIIICNERVISLIHPGITVTIDCNKGFVYNGVITN